MARKQQVSIVLMEVADSKQVDIEVRVPPLPADDFARLQDMAIALVGVATSPPFYLDIPRVRQVQMACVLPGGKRVVHPIDLPRSR